MKKALSLTLLLALCLLVTGCFRHTLTVGTGAPDGKLVYRAWHHHWLFGLIRPEHQEDVLVSELCPSGNATIHEETSFLNGLVDVLIGVIYSPTTVTITCEDGTQASVVLGADEVAEIVNDPLFFEVLAERAPERVAEAEEALASTSGRTAFVTASAR